MMVKVILLFGVVLALGHCQKNVICYYNHRAFYREGPGRFNASDIVPALQYCTHLIYGYAGINPETFKLESLNKILDIQNGNYRTVIDLKKDVSGLKILLSVGGNEDVGEDEDKSKYLSLLESKELRENFIDSALETLKTYRFDGLDLAWEFPETQPKKNRGVLSSAFHSIKNKIVGKSTSDPNAEDHKEQFTSLIRELRSEFKNTGHLLTLTVLPNVNSTIYFDPRTVAANLDLITLDLFDYFTPNRNPKVADYPAPLNEGIDRRFDENIDFQVRFWLENGTPKQKLILGVPSYGLVWKLDDDVSSEIPPVDADGPGLEGPLTHEKGLLSYGEICALIGSPEKKIGLIKFSNGRSGNYAFRLPIEKDGIDGSWVGYEDPESVAKKGQYVKAKGLGGIAVIDLTFDDFRGSCTGTKYPIVKAAKQALN